MTTASQVAEYILSNSNPQEGDIISHLKLQKLLYYCQGFHLAIRNAPLFSESIHHWDHGPVVPDLYYQYKKYGNAALPIPENFDDSVITQSEKEVIDEVLTVYGQFSAWKLRNMTHDEPPWKDTDDCDEITHRQLIAYFSSQVIDED